MRDEEFMQRNPDGCKRSRRSGGAAALMFALLVSAGVARGQAITEFPVPIGGTGIAEGPDGNLWFTELREADVVENEGSQIPRIGRITTAGVVTEFPLPGSRCGGAAYIAAGPDGNLWFTEFCDTRIGRITTAGVVTEFSIPTSGSGPLGIAAGPDGNLWFTLLAGNRIGRITTAGVITEFPIPTPNSGPYGIAAGPDGNLWFTEAHAAKIGRITTDGVFTEFSGLAGNPQGITAGADGNLWFTEPFVGKVGRITTSGVITEFYTPGAPGGIAAGPDGNLWITAFLGGNLMIYGIERITTTGVATPFPIPRPNSGASGIAAGPDGNIWFTELGFLEGRGSKIGRITTGPAIGPGIVNGLVAMSPLHTSFSPTSVSGGPAGTLTITATFKNTSSSSIHNPYFKVSQLSGGNLLLYADGGPGGLGATLSPDVGADRMLAPGESFTTRFVIGLQHRSSFNFFVDFWGEADP
jgi:streptogramin lyase